MFKLLKCKKLKKHPYEVTNYVSSVEMLVSYSRHIGRSFKSEYEKKAEELKYIAPTAFIKFLRNKVLHQSTPSLQRVVLFSCEQEEVCFCFPKEEILNNKKAETAVKDWAKKQSDKIDVLKVFEAYQKSISDFHVWLVNKMKEFYSQDLEALENIEKELKKPHPQ